MTWFEYLALASAATVAVATIGAAVAAYMGQREQLAAVTGGDSYVYLEPLRREGKVRYFVRQNGHHPTFDAVVRIQEIMNSNPRLVFGPADVGRTLLRGSGFDWTYPDPTFSDRREWPLVFPEPPAKGAAPRKFRIELAARNGIFVQELRVWPVGNCWNTASRQIVHAGVGPIVLPNDFHEAQEQNGEPG